MDTIIIIIAVLTLIVAIVGGYYTYKSFKKKPSSDKVEIKVKDNSGTIIGIKKGAREGNAE